MDEIIKDLQYTIQHGSYNDRIYVMKVKEGQSQQLLEKIKQLLEDHQYGKVFAKIPQSERLLFEKSGFVEEAMIPDYFEENKDVLFMSKYSNPERSIDSLIEQNEDVLERSFAKTLVPGKKAPGGFTVNRATKNDADDIAALYKETFSSYPFPIYDPEYIVNTMEDDVDYYLIKQDGQLAAVSSAEKDPQTRTAEMTDFATRESYQGNQLAGLLLREMETQLKKEEYRIVYTIARACSIPMNVTFSRANYIFSGKLINNTNISGSIESMNVWYKNLCI